MGEDGKIVKNSQGKSEERAGQDWASGDNNIAALIYRIHSVIAIYFSDCVEQTGIDFDGDGTIGGQSPIASPATDGTHAAFNEEHQSQRTQKSSAERAHSLDGGTPGSPSDCPSLPRSGSAPQIAIECYSDSGEKSLEVLLMETMRLLEGSFSNFDVDGSKSMFVFSTFT